MKRLILTLTLVVAVAAYLAVEFYSHKTNVVQQPEKDGPANPGWYEQWFAMKKNDQGVIPYDLIRQIRLEQQSQGRGGMSNLLNVTELGPINVGGRTRALLVDYTDENHLLAGGISGGLWISNDGGQSWNSVNDFSATLSITDITQNPFNPDIFYYSTGEPAGNSAGITGNGIYKSTDGGKTFAPLPASLTHIFNYTYRVRCSPVDSNTIYVATKYYGVMRSTDGGQSFKTVFISGGNHITDIELFQDSSIVVGLHSGGIYRSENGDSSTYTKLTTGLPISNFARIELAYCDSVPGTMYAVFEHAAGDKILNVYKTVDTGKTWAMTTNPANSSISFAFPWYCLTMAVKPDNPLFVMIGSVQLGFSPDGGATWIKAHNSHSDYHNILFNPFDVNEIYIGNDGGVYRYSISNITGGATDLNKGYNVTQFYAGTYFPTGKGYYAGTQDNGTQATTSGAPVTNHIFGGDGAFTHINQQDDNMAFVSYQYGRIHRTDFAKSAFPSFYKVTNEMDANNDNNLDDGGWFINPFEINLLNGEQIFFPTRTRVWRSVDGALSWEAITGNFSGVSNQRPYSIGISNSTSPTIYIGGENGLLYRMENADVATSSALVNLNSTLPVNVKYHFIANIAVHPQYDSVIYVSFSNYSPNPRLYKVTNAKSSTPVWTSIHGNMPAGMPVNWMEVSPYNDSLLIAATDFGLYTSVDGGTDWTFEPEIPNVSIHQIRLRRTDGRLFIYTHGRGVWTANIPVPPQPPVGISSNSTVKINIYPNPASDFINISFENRSITHVELYNIRGQLIRTEAVYNDQHRLNIPNLQKGTYFLRFRNGKDVVGSDAFVKG